MDYQQKAIEKYADYIQYSARYSGSSSERFLPSFLPSFLPFFSLGWLPPELPRLIQITFLVLDDTHEYR
jgi:hypothetical protein